MLQSKNICIPFICFQRISLFFVLIHRHQVTRTKTFGKVIIGCFWIIYSMNPIQAHNQFLQIMARRPWEEIQQILVIFLQYILMQLRKSLDQDWIFLLSWIAPRTQQEHNLIFISIFSGNHQCCRDQYANIACFQGLLISRIIFRSFSLLR